MATIRYKCDTCLKEVEFLENKSGLTSLSNCILTENCSGNLFKVGRNNRSRTLLTQNINPNENFISRQPRKVFFPFSKDIASKKWSVKHNLGTFPAISVFVEINDGFDIVELNKSEYIRTDVDENTLEILFDSARTGKVHAISRSVTENSVPQSAFLEDTIDISPNGTLSIAVLSKAFNEVTPINYTDPLKIRFDVTLKEPNQEEIFCIEEFNGSLASPWSDYNAISFRKRRNYIVKTGNIIDLKVIQERYDSLEEIPELTELTFNKISYGDSPFFPIRSKNALILLTNPPYEKIDKILNKVIDLGEKNVEENPTSYVFSGGRLLADNEDVEAVYPDIEKDDILVDIPALEPSNTPTPSPTSSVTPTPTPTPSVSDSATPTPTPSASESATPTPTPTSSPASLDLVWVNTTFDWDVLSGSVIWDGLCFEISGTNTSTIEFNSNFAPVYGIRFDLTFIGGPSDSSTNSSLDQFLATGDVVNIEITTNAGSTTAQQAVQSVTTLFELDETTGIFDGVSSLEPATIAITPTSLSFNDRIVLCNIEVLTEEGSVPPSTPQPTGTPTPTPSPSPAGDVFTAFIKWV